MTTYLVILRSTVAVVAVFLNITFFFICFKKLRMKLHTLLILVFHMSDVFLGIGSIWFTLSLLVPSMRINVRSYLFAISAMMFGLISKYSILFMISLERFLIIKFYNFGMRHTFDKFKIHLIIGIMSFAFLGSVGPSFTPHTNTIDASIDPHNMYVKSYPIFVLVFMAILTLLFLLIVTTTSISAYYIWKIFFKSSNKIVPLTLENVRNFSVQTAPPDTFVNVPGPSNSHQMRISTVIPFCRIERVDHDHAETVFVNPIKDENRINSHDFDGVEDLQGNDSDEEQNVDYNESEIKQLEIDVNHVVMEEIQRESKELKFQRKWTKQHKILKPRSSLPNLQVKIETDKYWEIRAFNTSVLVACTTFLLTGPFFTHFWIAYFLDIKVPMETRFILLTLYTINSLIDPFVYAWRIPEMREQFKKLCRIK